MDSRPILVFGARGQVAQALKAHKNVITAGRDTANITDASNVENTILAIAPRAIVNAAAFTAVDQCETEQDLAFAVNAQAAGYIAKSAARHGLPLVHISTDYVFDGSGAAPILPDHAVRPLCVYGASKAQGETHVRAAGGVHAILRTSWVFAPGHANFVTKMQELSQTHTNLSVVGDQVGGPTPARSIAQACLTIANALAQDRSKSGTYHFAGTPCVSWAEFARHIFDATGKTTQITPISSTEYPTPAERPKN
ncbi:MAG: dTDP-4-dehydrorhamnose reductase, partial [Pseudomonadota bacterium]